MTPFYGTALHHKPYYAPYIAGITLAYSLVPAKFTGLTLTYPEIDIMSNTSDTFPLDCKLQRAARRAVKLAKRRQSRARRQGQRT